MVVQRTYNAPIQTYYPRAKVLQQLIWHAISNNFISFNKTQPQYRIYHVGINVVQNEKPINLVLTASCTQFVKVDIG